MIYFDNFEEMRAAYPLDSDHNQSFFVRLVYQHVFSGKDVDFMKEKYPDGWLDKEDHRYYYYEIQASTWYTHYIYDGEKWKLGMDSWDGIYEAEEPGWGVERGTMFSSEYGTFKTKAEAIDYKNKKLKERLEF